ncbi:MAG: zinc-finger domain-containing protein [Lachnospiraceae bacterium]|nr:zinc-finger domain-containing protein [Lachnospiraceae bacterium]
MYGNTGCSMRHRLRKRSGNSKQRHFCFTNCFS